MLKRMAELGLVEHEPYHGVALTEAGERVALEVIRHHRLIEAYLAEALGMPWDRVHDEAEVLEHYISEELEERIAAALGDPSRDPHGDPIPDRELAHRREDERLARRARAGRERRLLPGLRLRLRDAPLPRPSAGSSPGAELRLRAREPVRGAAAASRSTAPSTRSAAELAAAMRVMVGA